MVLKDAKEAFESMHYLYPLVVYMNNYSVSYLVMLFYSSPLQHIKNSASKSLAVTGIALLPVEGSA